jgi:16S rRNA (guanine527-N7)-methyltransferase
VSSHIDHAEAFRLAVGRPPARAIDLGTGGGVPGLILARRWDDSSWLLVESGERRAAFLRDAVHQLDLADRCVVDERRAEVVGHDPACRGSAEVVTARSFGSPAVVAECAAPLLQLGGNLLVSEPPVGNDRWPIEGLSLVGLHLQSILAHGAAHIAVLEQVAPCPDGYPRRTGVPAKRPLFTVSRETTSG